MFDSVPFSATTCRSSSLAKATKGMGYLKLMNVGGVSPSQAAIG